MPSSAQDGSGSVGGVEAHEGRIDVLSQEGQGTEFLVILPLPEQEAS